MSEHRERVEALRAMLNEVNFRALDYDLQVGDADVPQSELRGFFNDTWTSISRREGCALTPDEVDKYRPVIVNTLVTLYSPEGDYYRFRTAQHFVTVLLDEVQDLSTEERGLVISALIFGITCSGAFRLRVSSMQYEEWMDVWRWLWSCFFQIDTFLEGGSLTTHPPRGKPGPKKRITDHQKLFTEGGFHRLRSFLIGIDCFDPSKNELTVSDKLKGWNKSPFSRSSKLSLLKAIYLLSKEADLLVEGHRQKEAMEILCSKFNVPGGKKINDFKKRTVKPERSYLDNGNMALKGTVLDQQKDLLKKLWTVFDKEPKED